MVNKWQGTRGLLNEEWGAVVVEDPIINTLLPKELFTLIDRKITLIILD